MHIQDDNFTGSATGPEAIKQLGLIALEKEKTRRLLLAIACSLIILGGVGVLFAPENKTTASYIIGSVMSIFALGAIGAASFKIKTPVIEVEKNTFNRTPSISSEFPRES
jgi:cyanate permease